MNLAGISVISIFLEIVRSILERCFQIMNFSSRDSGVFEASVKSFRRKVQVGYKLDVHSQFFLPFHKNIAHKTVRNYSI